MGGFDVFKATFNPKTNEWSEPVNLGYPINTPDDDIYFVSRKMESVPIILLFGKMVWAIRTYT